MLIKRDNTLNNESNLQERIEQERLPYIIARGKLLQFFLVHMYSNNTEIFNAKNNAYLNDMERMKYFIGRFNKYHNDDTYEFMVIHPLDAKEHQEDYTDDDITNAVIIDIKNSIKTIKEYLGLE